MSAPDVAECMRLADRYAAASGADREAPHIRAALQATIEQLVTERDNALEQVSAAVDDYNREKARADNLSPPLPRGG